MNILKITRILRIWALTAFLACVFSVQAWALESAVLLQSVPLETDLADPDIATTQAGWIDMIQHARDTIDMAQFYAASESGQALEPVIDALEKAGTRGVKIRILLSNKMVGQDKPTFERLGKIAGAKIELLDLKKPANGILHAKYFVVDGQEIFVGSQNFDWRALSQIHETGVRLRDRRIASQLEGIFDADWAFATDGGAAPSQPAPDSKKRKSAARAPIELVASPPMLNPPGIRWSIPALLELIGSARKSLRIQTMSYSLTDKFAPKTGPGAKSAASWTEIDDALRKAARRGVSVQLIVADWSVGHPAIDELKSLGQVRGVEIRIVSFPESKSGHIPFARVTHSKYMVVDGKKLWLGTSNWERNYFYGSRNVELIFRKDPALAARAGAVFTKLWSSAYAEKLDPKRDYLPRKQN